jgi:hypothetical protein
VADLTLSCACGKLTAVAEGVTRGGSNRCICHCRFCRQYAERLGMDGVLDDKGGTEVIQFSPRKLRFTGGEENLACLRQTSKGALRWYAKCCNTPIANTAGSPKLPFVGVVRRAVKAPVGDALTKAVGPVRARIYLPPEMQRGANWAQKRMMARILRLLLFWKLRGDGKRSPFFDKDGKPIRAVERVGAGGGA